MAFFKCTSLEGVYLPPTINYIGDDAFRYCKSLKFFYVPEAIEHIGIHVVGGCDPLLTTVTNTNMMPMPKAVMFFQAVFPLH